MAVAAVGAALAVATAGCGSAGRLATAGNSEASTPTATSSSQASSPAAKAPPVTNPLSVQKFLKHPCDLLTKSRAKALGATKPGSPENVGDLKDAGPICHWHNRKTLAAFSISILTEHNRGLGEIYQANEDPGYYAFFNPTTIIGYPGVFVGMNDSRGQGTCALDFAVNNRVVLFAGHIDASDTRHPCGKVKKVAAAVITTIKESS
jgi:hypothetical protein